MREILFKGKRGSDGKWLYGLYSDERVWGTDFPVIMPLETDNTDGDWAIIPETVGQYTGFHDVDKVRIFEGDIVKDIESGYHYIVKWFDEYGCFALANKAGHMEIDVSELEIYIDYLVVVGNIHDNGDLTG